MEIIDYLKKEVKALQESAKHWDEIIADLTKSLGHVYSFEDKKILVNDIIIRFGSYDCPCCVLVNSCCSACPLKKYSNMSCGSDSHWISFNKYVIENRNHLINEKHIYLANEMLKQINEALLVVKDKLIEELLLDNENVLVSRTDEVLPSHVVENFIEEKLDQNHGNVSVFAITIDHSMDEDMFDDKNKVLVFIPSTSRDNKLISVVYFGYDKHKDVLQTSFDHYNDLIRHIITIEYIGYEYDVTKKKVKEILNF